MADFTANRRRVQSTTHGLIVPKMSQWILFLLELLTIITTTLSFSSEACLSVCHCDGDHNATTISCAHKNLTRIPAELSINEWPDLNQNNESDAGIRIWNFTRILSLDLSFNIVVIVEEQDFINQQQLQVLSLKNNRITEIEWGSFRPLTSLLTLDLFGNNLTSLDNYTLFGLTSLKTLNLSGNQIAELGNASFSSLTVLDILDLSFNLITSVDCSSFTGLSYLRVLNLSHNSISYIDSFTFQSLLNLEALQLATNNIEYLNRRILMGMKRIKYLDLSSNNLVNISADTFGENSVLESLIMDRNPIEKITSFLLRKQEKLKYLSISYMQNLDYLSPHVFEHLTGLKTLEINNNAKLSVISGDVFMSLGSLQLLDLSNNNLTVLTDSLRGNNQGLSLYIGGNHFLCDCLSGWIIEVIQQNNSFIDIHDKYNLTCTNPFNGELYLMSETNRGALQCDNVSIINCTGNTQAEVGSMVVFKCEIEGTPHASITWITPRNKHLTYHNFHPYAIQHLQHPNNTMPGGMSHTNHPWHNSNTYHSERLNDPKRIIVLQDGSLFIDYVLRSDAGRYTCIAKTPHYQTSQKTRLTLDYKAMYDVQITSLIVGVGCAATFFMLNLIYVLISAAARRCINQRRREAINHLVENLYQYKSTQVTKIRDNYSVQVNRIREQYHYQLTRLRGNYTRQKVRIKDGCSHQMERIRDNYNTQTGKLKDYTSHQLDQLRDMYNNQLLKIRDYGSSQLDKIRKKYKLKQQHVLKLLETVNIDNCRTMIDTECVKTGSALFETEIQNKTDLSSSTPNGSAGSDLDFVDGSGSDLDYVTASSDSSNFSSREHIHGSEGETTNVVDPSIVLEEHELEKDDIDEKCNELSDSLRLDFAPNIDMHSVEIQMMEDMDNEIQETVI